MPSPIAFVGDAATAAGFRLAGAAVYVPAEGAELAAVERARGEAAVVVLAAGHAARLPLGWLEAALAAPAPLLLIMPDPGGRPARVDPAARVRVQLGLAQ